MFDELLVFDKTEHRVLIERDPRVSVTPWLTVLHQLGLSTADEADGGDRVVRLARSGSGQAFRLLQATSPPAGASVAEQRPPILLLLRRVNAKQAERLREQQAQFVDLSGNAYISFGNVLIDVRGASRPDGDASRGRPANLFSGRRSQIVAALLTWPFLVDAPLRDLAGVSGTSLSLVHQTKNALGQLSYDPAGSTRHRLLDAWAANYPLNLGPQLEMTAFMAERQELVVPAEVPPAYVSGEAAAPAIRSPLTLSLYSVEFPTAWIRLNRWRRDRKADVFLRRQFWTPPSGAEPAYEVTVRGGRLPAAPWPLVYGDLMSSTDPRLMQAAVEWRECHAG
ncbi:hypothetical protein KLP28_09450 [Nocardioidaceae bacterium]|nr:hypothetical protein KLP28_09450 [Nocardioidaceae bacterium]